MQAPELRVYTYREGLLSAVGHDLALGFERFQVELSSTHLTASVELASLRVLGAMKRARVAAEAVSPADRADIERSAREEVLRSTRHPTAHFEGKVSQTRGVLEARGELALHGARHPWALRGAVEGQAVVARGELVPSRWGIRPFRALGGALKVKDRVEVVLTLPLAQALPPDLAALELTWKHPAP